MKHPAAALLATCVLAAAAPSALACQMMSYDPSVVRINAASLPTEMLQAAARVDVAVPEAVEPVDVDALLDQLWAGELARATTPAEKERIAKIRRVNDEPGMRRPEFGQIRFRVEETLKGAPEASFTLTGYLLSDDLGTRGLGADGPKSRGGYRSPSAVYDYIPMVQGHMESGADCNRGLWAHKFVRYLIFRDAAGNLLGEVISPDYRYGYTTRHWPVLVPLGQDDPWLDRVRKVADKAR